MPCFDDIPEDYRESYPCPKCDEGNVTESEDFAGAWECDTCEFFAIGMSRLDPHGKEVR